MKAKLVYKIKEQKTPSAGLRVCVNKIELGDSTIKIDIEKIKEINNNITNEMVALIIENSFLIKEKYLNYETT